MSLTQSQKIGVAGLCICIYSVLFGAFILRAAVNFGVRKQVALINGSQTRGIWGKFPFPIEMKIYLFNVTNPDEIEKGEKPILQEVGPFVYDEWQEKVNQEDREEDDTVSYSVKSTYYFNEALSGNLTGDEEFIVPNIFILGMVNSVLKERPSALPIISKAIDIILRKPSSVFMKQKAKTLLFDGFVVDCNVEGTAGVAVCSEMKKNAKEFGLKTAGENQYLFSLWGGKNGTVPTARTRVYRGSKDVMKVGVVIEHNNKSNISVWNDDYCDKFNGTDGTIFHPFFNAKGKEDIVFYSPGMCRSLSLRYSGEIVKWEGMKLLRYRTGFGIDVEENPRHKCYCADSDDCLRKGVFDLYKCARAPVVMSNPHFYDADPYYLSLVEGLEPDQKKHEMYMDLNAFAGAPVRARGRVQINMFIRPLAKFKLMKEFPEALCPIFWMESGIDVPDWVVKQIKQGKMQLSAAHMFQHLMMAGGFGMFAYAAFKQFSNKAKDDTVVTVARLVTTTTIDVKELGKSAEQRPITSQSSRNDSLPNGQGELEKSTIKGNDIVLRPASLPTWID